MISVKGIMPPIATPFAERGALDEAALERNIARWNETGLTGYVVAGSNGESALLEDAEVVAAVRTVRRAARAEHLVVAGTGRQSTGATIGLTRAAAEAGADVALVMTPSFFGAQMTSAALQQHYERVADASPIPILVYNVPKFTYINMAPEAVAPLSAHPQIVGIKDSAGNIGQIIDLLRLCAPGFQVLVGNAPAFLSAMQVGAVGAVLALANVAPRECVRIAQAVAAGEDELARALQFRLMPVAKAVTSGYGIAGLKAALDLLGWEGGAPRPPLQPLPPADRQTIKQLLQEAGLLA